MKEHCSVKGCTRKRGGGHIEGKPYCGTHYTNLKNQLRRNLTVKLINDLDTLLIKHPELSKELNQANLKRLRVLFKELRAVPAKSTTKEAPADRLERLETVVAGLAELLKSSKK